VSPSIKAARCRSAFNAHKMSVVISSLLCLTLAGGCGSFAAQGRNSEGVRLFQQAEYHRALEHFQDAIHNDPDDADGYYNLAASYHRIGALENRPSHLKTAEHYYNQCLDRDDDHQECYRALAVLLAEQGRTDEAFRLIEGWVDKRPNSSGARIELARLCQEHNCPADAKNHLIDALKLAPDNPRALAALGKIREDMGDEAQALKDYQRSLECDRFQHQVAGRVAALQAKTGRNSWSTPTGGGTRLVDRESTPLR